MPNSEEQAAIRAVATRNTCTMCSSNPTREMSRRSGMIHYRNRPVDQIPLWELLNGEIQKIDWATAITSCPADLP